MVEILNLQLFADGAAVGGAEGSAGNSLGDNTGDAGAENMKSADGKGSDAGNIEGTKDVDRDFDAEFEKLIKGEYKTQFDKRVQDVINRRFKAQRSTMEEYEATKPIIDVLAQKYGTSDIAALTDAFKNDSALWEASAEKEGMDVDQFKEIMQLRAENERYRRQHEMSEQQRQIAQQIEAWQRQGEEVKAEYPQFDLDMELQNKDFLGLIKNGIPMKMAYKLIHSEEVESAIRQEAEKKVMDNVRANRQRPPENISKNPNGFVLGKDVSAMTKADRDEIKRRVSLGEKIVL